MKGLNFVTAAGSAGEGVTGTGSSCRVKIVNLKNYTWSLVVSSCRYFEAVP